MKGLIENGANGEVKETLKELETYQRKKAAGIGTPDPE
jgi:hypothetical protein